MVKVLYPLNANHKSRAGAGMHKTIVLTAYPRVSLSVLS